MRGKSSCEANSAGQRSSASISCKQNRALHGGVYLHE